MEKTIFRGCIWFDRSEFNRCWQHTPRGGCIGAPVTPNPFSIVSRPNSCMAGRDTRYLPFPGEGIEAFKRRTFDTTRHLTCSGAGASREALSGVSYLCPDTFFPCDPIGSPSFSACLFLFLPFATPPTFPSRFPSRFSTPVTPKSHPSRSFPLSQPPHDLLVIQNLRTLVALPAYSSTHTDAHAHIHAGSGCECTHTHVCSDRAQPWNCFTFKSVLRGTIHWVAGHWLISPSWYQANRHVQKFILLDRNRYPVFSNRDPFWSRLTLRM